MLTPQTLETQLVQGDGVLQRRAGGYRSYTLVGTRFNYATNGEALQALEVLKRPVTIQNLSSALSAAGLCDASEGFACQASLLGTPLAVLVSNTNSDTGSLSQTSTSNEKIAIVVTSCVVGLSLIMCSVVMAYRWRKASASREKSDNYTLSDMMEAAQRGKPENLQAAIAADFRLPPAFRAPSSVASGSIRSGESPFQSFKAPSHSSKAHISRPPSFEPSELHAKTWIVDHSVKDDPVPSSTVMGNDSVSGFLTTGSRHRQRKQKKLNKTKGNYNDQESNISSHHDSPYDFAHLGSESEGGKKYHESRDMYLKQSTRSSGMLSLPALCCKNSLVTIVVV